MGNHADISGETQPLRAPTGECMLELPEGAISARNLLQALRWRKRSCSLR